MELNIKFNIEPVLEKLKFLNKDLGFIRKKITREILKPIKNEVRRTVRRKLTAVTRKTAQRTDIWAFENGAGRLFLGTRYGRILEKAHSISPKKKAFMQFKIKGKWIRTKKTIFVKDRDLAASSWSKGTEAAKMVQIADKIMQKELDKWINKK